MSTEFSLLFLLGEIAPNFFYLLIFFCQVQSVDVAAFNKL